MSGKKGYFPPPVLPCTGVESHAHLDDRYFAEDFTDVMKRAQAAGVAYIGQVFLSPDAYHAEVEKFAPYSQVFFLLGIHPTEAFLYSPAIRAEMKKLLQQDCRIRCIGEIGLDYYWKDVAPDLQKEVFTAQLVLAKEVNYPIALHSRDAFEDTFSLLCEHGFVGREVLWHCFGGDKEQAKRIIDAGWHISIPGTVTFPVNAALRDAVSLIPLDRLLVETDSPYLTPVPFRGKRNEPAYLGYTIQKIAEVKAMDVGELWTICGENAKRFFKLSVL